MIPLQELREKQRETGIALEVLEKDYCLGWMLKGIADSPLSGQVVLKGGTALRKLYFPLPARQGMDRPRAMPARRAFIRPASRPPAHPPAP